MAQKTKEDPYFKQNVKQCEELSIPYGVYYYSLAQDAIQAKKEADFVTSLLDNKVPDLGVFIDLEDEEFQEDLSNDTLTVSESTFSTSNIKLFSVLSELLVITFGAA